MGNKVLNSQIIVADAGKTINVQVQNKILLITIIFCAIMLQGID